MPLPTGTNSVTIPGIAGAEIKIARLSAYFPTTGPATGTLRIKEGATTVWEAAVSGGIYMAFVPVFTIAAGEDCTVELTGGRVWVAAQQR